MPSSTLDSPAALSRVPLLAWAALFLLAALPFSTGFSGAFVYDDVQLLLENRDITQPDRLRALLSSPYLAFYKVDVGYWRPLSSLTLWGTWRIAGPDPFLFKLVSAALHGGVVLVAFALLRRLLSPRPLAFAAALVFAWVPLHVESVSWIAAVNVPQQGLFSLLAVLALVRWRERGSSGLPLLSGAALLAALLSRETALTTLGLLFFVDYLARRANGFAALPTTLRTTLRAMVPAAVAVAVYMTGRIAAYGDLRAGLDRQVTDFDFSWARMALLRLENLGGGLVNLAWPLNPTLMRAVPPEFSLADPRQLLPMLALGAFVALGVFALKRRAGTILVCLTWLAVTLAPLGAALEAQARSPLADRMLYLPALGMVALFGVLGARMLRDDGARKVLIGALLLAAVGLGFATAGRAETWNDEEQLYRAATTDNPYSAAAAWSLGRVLQEQHRLGGEPAKLAEAEQWFIHAQDLGVSEARGEARDVVGSEDLLQSNLGIGWIELVRSEADGFGDFSGALAVYERIVAGRPDSVDAHQGLGVTQVRAGLIEEGLASLRTAIEIRPDAPGPIQTMGIVLHGLGRFDEALRFMEQAVELQPVDPETLLWAARSAGDAGRSDLSEQFARRSLELQPMDPGPLHLLGVLELKDSDWIGALERFDAALVLEPTHAPSHDGRAKALMGLGQPADALLAWRSACEFGPELFEPHYNVASLLLSNGTTEAALPYLLRAYETCPTPEQRSSFRGTLEAVAPDELGVWLELAFADRSHGDLGIALEWTRRALALEPREPLALALAGEMYAELGRPELALEPLETLLVDHPGNLKAWATLGAVRTELGDTPGAAAAFRSGLQVIDEGAAGNPALENLRPTFEQSLADLPIGPSPAQAVPEQGE